MSILNRDRSMHLAPYEVAEVKRQRSFVLDLLGFGLVCFCAGMLTLAVGIMQAHGG